MLKLPYPAGGKPSQLDREQPDEQQRQQEGRGRLAEDRDALGENVDDGVAPDGRGHAERNADKRADAEGQAGEQEGRAEALHHHIQRGPAEAVGGAHVALHEVADEAQVLDRYRVGQAHFIPQERAVGLCRLGRQHEVRRVADEAYDDEDDRRDEEDGHQRLLRPEEDEPGHDGRLASLAVHAVPGQGVAGRATSRGKKAVRKCTPPAQLQANSVKPDPPL